RGAMKGAGASRWLRSRPITGFPEAPQLAWRVPLSLGTVDVKSATGFAPEPTGRHQIAEQRRGAVLAVGEISVQDLGDRKHRVEANQIRQCERSERVIQTEPDGLVDVLDAGHAVAQGEARFVQKGDEHPVHDESRAV